MLLASGVPVTADELTPQVFIPGREGSLQLEMLAAARRHGRVPYPLPPQAGALLDAVAAGQPVLVLQNLGVELIPVWHYAVLVGFDPRHDEVVLRSGDTERRRMRFHHFLASWERGGRWGVVVTPPHHIPAAASPAEWVAAVAAFESLHRADLAEQGYAAATRRWPEAALPWFALGNARYAQRDLGGATAALRAAVRLEPSAAAYNNLASVLLERGCARQARAALDRALALAPAPAEAEILRRTGQAIQGYAGRASRCD